MYGTEPTKDISTKASETKAQDDLKESSFLSDKAFKRKPHPK
jgi:hypothetical protein